MRYLSPITLEIYLGESGSKFKLVNDSTTSGDRSVSSDAYGVLNILFVLTRLTSTENVP